jgi:hypothetical protein
VVKRHPAATTHLGGSAELKKVVASLPETCADVITRVDHRWPSRI